MATPRANTIGEDISQFTGERQKFVQEVSLFKLGQIAHGFVAVDLLESMYQILLSSHHQAKDIAEQSSNSKIYVGAISTYRADLLEFHRRKGMIDLNNGDLVLQLLRDAEFKAMVDRFNGLVYDFYRIKAEVGMS